MPDNLSFGWEILAIVWINILLSGDNAILIALACRNLPEKQQRIGIIFGALGAVALRIVFTLAIGQLLDVVLLKIAGGLFVIWLAITLPDQSNAELKVDAQQTLFAAVRSIIVADAVMSLDNVLSVAAAANGSQRLIVFGLLLSAPLVMFGARFLSALMERFPILIIMGAVILGWAGGELIAGDPIWARLGMLSHLPASISGGVGSTIVIIVLLAMAASRRIKDRVSVNILTR